MRTSVGRIRIVMYLMVALMISAALAACGGGGGSTGSTSPGTSGPATVSVSIASAPSYPEGTTFAPSTLSPVTTAAPANSPTFDNVIVTVTKLALIPSTGPEFPDANGESEMPNSSAEEGKSGMSGFVTTTFDPVKIDLLHPPAGDNVNVAALLNKFSEVRAGEYSKIRVYYENVVGQKEGQLDAKFHPTANYHFDVHFVGGNLVIPESTDKGVRFYSVVIKLVGLKYHLAGQSSNVLLRPQVFATVVDEPMQYKVTGFADNVTKQIFNGTFDIHALGGRTIPAQFYGTGTAWAYSDNVLEDSDPLWVIPRAKEIAVPAFENGAIVSAIGVFDTKGLLQARVITFSFPDVRQGKADNVWIPPDNTAFIIRSTDNVTVFPRPDRYGAYYDNLTSPHNTLDNTYIDNNLCIRARGYFDDPGKSILSSYWISIGGLAPCP